MSLAELMPHLQSLLREEKLRAIQFLADNLAREEQAPPLQSGKEYPLPWSPWDAYEAAATLMQVLEAAKGKQ